MFCTDGMLMADDDSLEDDIDETELELLDDDIDATDDDSEDDELPGRPGIDGHDEENEKENDDVPKLLRIVFWMQSAFSMPFMFLHTSNGVAAMAGNAVQMVTAAITAV